MANDDSAHHEFEQLAVEHVLGGLSPELSSRFRDHLISCEHCRRRVVELRGIAADLDLAARQERAVVRTRVETEPRRQDPEPERAAPRWTPDHVRNAVIILLAVTLAIVSFWNIHLRQVEQALARSLADRGAVLDVLVDGEVVPVDEVAPALELDVAATNDWIGVNARGVRSLRIVEQVVLWGRIDEETAWQVLAFAGFDGVPEGRLAMSGPLAGHTQVVLSIEQVPRPIEPTGDRLFSASLD